MRDLCWASARTVKSGRPIMIGDSGRATQGRPPRMRGNCTGGARRGSFGLWPLCSFLVGRGEWMEGWGQDQLELLAFDGCAGVVGWHWEVGRLPPPVSRLLAVSL